MFLGPARAASSADPVAKRPISLDQVKRLRSDHAIYMADNARANLIGIADRDLDRFCVAVVETMNG